MPPRTSRATPSAHVATEQHVRSRHDAEALGLEGRVEEAGAGEEAEDETHAAARVALRRSRHASTRHTAQQKR